MATSNIQDILVYFGLNVSYSETLGNGNAAVDTLSSS